MTTAKTITGLSFSITDATYGANVTFFTIGRIAHDLAQKTAQVTLRGYSTEEAAAKARMPLSYPVIDLAGAPAEGVTTAWAYQAIANAAGHALAGAVVVERTAEEIAALKGETPAAA